MRRVIIAILIILALGAAWKAAPFMNIIVAMIKNAPIKDTLVLNDFATTVGEKFVSCFIFSTGKGKVALVDAGVDPEGKAILAALKRMGLEPESVEAIFLTHGDRDHTAGCRIFSQARIYCSQADKANAEGQANSYKIGGKLLPARDSGCRVTNILKDGQTIKLGKVQVKLYAVPGHTPGSMAFLAGGVLFMGDSANVARSGKLTGGSPLFTENPALNLASLSSLARRLKSQEDNIKVIACAHTGPAYGLKPLEDLAQAK